MQPNKLCTVRMYMYYLVYTSNTSQSHSRGFIFSEALSQVYMHFSCLEKCKLRCQVVVDNCSAALAVHSQMVLVN